MLQEVSSGSFYRLCSIMISFFVLLPSLKHMSERQWGYIYRPMPPLSTLAPSLLPAPSLPQHIYMCCRKKYSCRKDLFPSEKYILVGRIYSCQKDISLHNITSGFSPLVQHKVSFFRQQYNKSLFIFISFFFLCTQWQSNSADFTFRNFPTSSLVRFSAFRFQSWSAISPHVHKHLESESVSHEKNTSKDPGEIHFSPHVHKHLYQLCKWKFSCTMECNPRLDLSNLINGGLYCNMICQSSQPCAQTPKISSESASSAVMYYGLEPKTS